MSTRAVSSLLPKVNLSFSGCGFLGIYHVGSYACWKDHQERSLKCINERSETAEDTKLCLFLMLLTVTVNGDEFREN